MHMKKISRSVTSFPAFLCCLLIFLAGCSTARPIAQSHTAHDNATVLLISIDGFRADYLQRGITPNISHLAKTGVQAEWMTPSYPSLTFPNHYTIVTGLRPDHHGIIHNSMSDPQLGRFMLSMREAVQDGRWWGGEPIWITAQKNGLRSATMFWPGSEANIQNLHPNQWKPFDGAVTPTQRVEQVIAWMNAPAAQRPNIVTLYFDQVDTKGHHFGPESEQVRQAMIEVDDAIGLLLKKLAAIDQRATTNIILVSDHGMATVENDQRITVEDMVSVKEAEITSIGQVIGINPNPGFEKLVEAKLINRADERYTCWRKQDLPPRFHYGTHPRIPAIICQMQEGWDALPQADLDKWQKYTNTRGSHGFDPALPSMRAIFIANGPAFKQSTTIPAFDNVDVYSLLTYLLGIPAAHNDGSLKALEPALKDPH